MIHLFLTVYQYYKYALFVTMDINVESNVLDRQLKGKVCLLFSSDECSCLCYDCAPFSVARTHPFHVYHLFHWFHLHGYEVRHP